MKNNQFLQKLIDYGLVSTLFVFPLFINIALISPADPGHPLVAVNISLADLMIGIILLVWTVKILTNNEWKQIKLPPAAVLIFIGIGILSFVNAFSLIQWLKELIQMIEYFLVFYVLLRNNLRTVKLTILKNSLFILTSVILVIAFVQHTFLSADPYFVKGLFENRNILGTFLCIVIPLVYAELLSSPQGIRKLWMGMLLLTTCLVLVSGSAMLSILISLFIISWLYGKKVFVRFLLVMLSLAAIYPFIMPLKNVNALKEFASIRELGNISENYYRRLTLLDHQDKNILLKKDLGNNFLLVTSDQLMSVKMPEIRKGERYKDMEDQKHIKNRYVEMQAALNMIAENTLLGVGLGNYQNGIGTCFGELPKVNTSEPNQNNTYLLIASTTGVWGLMALFSILMQLLSSSIRNYRNGITPENRALFLGLSGSMIAIMTEGFFSYLFVNSLLVPIIFIFYLSTSPCFPDKPRTTNLPVR